MRLPTNWAKPESSETEGWRVVVYGPSMGLSHGRVLDTECLGGAAQDIAVMAG